MKITKIEIVVILILLFVFHHLFFSQYLVANDLDYIFKERISEFLSLPLTWREFFVSDGLGEFTTFILNSWPYTLLYGLVGKLGIDFSSLVKLLGILPALILGFLGMRTICQYYGIKNWAAGIATLLYLTNTYILLLIDGGQVGLVVAYGLMPIIFVNYKKYFEENSFKNLSLFLGLTVVLSYFDIRICYLLFLLIFADGIQALIFKRQFRKIKRYFLIGGLTSFFLITAHLFWIWPSLFTKAPQLPATYTRESQVSFLSFANINHAFYLLQPHFPKNVFGKIDPIRAEFIFIPILVFLAPILRKKDPNISFWLIISAISIFLVKGISEPWPQVYPWVFSHIPGFSLFRDPTKFFFILALSYSILMGFTLQEILEKFRIRSFIKNAFVLTIILYLIVLIRPVFNNQTSGLFSKTENIQEYLELANFINQDKDFSRVLWIPRKPPLGYSNIQHPSLNAIDLLSKRPFAIGVVGAYERLNFLREATYSGQLLGLAGVKHIVYPYLDSKKDDIKEDNVVYYYKFLDQLSKQTWNNGRNKSVSIPTIDIKEYQDKFFIVSNIWWIIGSDNLYKKTVKDPSLKLSKNALIFVEQYPGLGKRVDELKNFKIILNGKTTLDLSASFIDPSNLIFPAKNLDFEPNTSGWWKREAVDLIDWRDFLQNKYGIDNQDFDLSGGWAIAEGEKSLSIKEKLEEGRVVLARVMESSRSGELTFIQDEKIVGKINTKTDPIRESNIRWFEVGKLFNNHSVTLSTKGDINVVNAVAILSEKQWGEFKKKSEELKKKGLVSDFTGSELENLPKIEFQRIDSTKYKVNTKNVTQPMFLIFSESYDNLWKLDNKSSIPVYSFLNGFLVEKDGDYSIEFEPQKYVVPGLMLTGLFFSLGIFLLFKLK